MTYVLPDIARAEALDSIDARVRIVATAIFAMVTVGLSSISVLALALAASVGVLVMSGRPMAETLRRMAAMDGFIIFMLVTLPFTVPGEPMVTVWGISASWAGLWMAVEIALTANAVILMVLVLIGGLEATSLGQALHALRVPARLVHLLLFTVRYIDVLRQEYIRMRAAMTARGFRARTSMHCYRSYGYLVGMMLVRAMDRSERIMAAMKCRGFTGQMPVIAQFRMTMADAQFIILFGTILVSLIMLNITHVV
jgi:cobalt/nickel transport system permease protein